MHVGILVSFFCPYVPTHEVRKRKRWRQRGFKMGIVWVTEASCYLVSGQRCFPVQIIPQQSVVPFISCTGGYVQEKNTGWMDHWFDPGSSFHWTARMRLSLWWCFEISSCFNKPCGCYRCQKPFNSYAKGFFSSKHSPTSKQKYLWNLNLNLHDAEIQEDITWMVSFHCQSNH